MFKDSTSIHAPGNGRYYCWHGNSNALELVLNNMNQETLSLHLKTFKKKTIMIMTMIKKC